MKTKLFIVLISAIFSLQLLNAQTTYMPIFGDTTSYYYYRENLDSRDFYRNDYIKDNNKEHCYAGVQQNCLIIEVSEDNSKMWVLDCLTKTNKTLIMDLNLAVGDTFMCSSIKYTVEQVYVYNNRKHIVFENLCEHVTGESCELFIEKEPYVRITPLSLKFIEGVGPNIMFGGNCIPYHQADLDGISWVCSQNKDGIFYYGMPEFYPHWGVENFSLSSPNVNADTIIITPNPVEWSFSITLPNNINNTNTQIQLKDVAGKIIQTFSVNKNPFTFDISSYPVGMYLIEIIAPNYKGITKKILKK